MGSGSRSCSVSGSGSASCSRRRRLRGSGRSMSSRRSRRSRRSSSSSRRLIAKHPNANVPKHRCSLAAASSSRARRAACGRGRAFAAPAALFFSTAGDPGHPSIPSHWSARMASTANIELRIPWYCLECPQPCPCSVSGPICTLGTLPLLSLGLAVSRSVWLAGRLAVGLFRSLTLSLSFSGAKRSGQGPQLCISVSLALSPGHWETCQMSPRLQLVCSRGFGESEKRSRW